MDREEKRHAIAAGDKYNQGKRDSYSVVSGEGEDACPVGAGDATIPKGAMACWDGPELVITHELELDEVVPSAFETGQGLVAEESWVSPALLELKERLPWGIGDTPVEDMRCEVLGEVVSMCDDWHTDWSADVFQVSDGMSKGERRVRGIVFQNMNWPRLQRFFSTGDRPVFLIGATNMY